MSGEKVSMKLNQIPELTGLRGLAALLIIINHLVLLVPMLKQTGVSHCTLLCGFSGMSLFFVLSGIVIYYNYASMLVERPVEVSYSSYLLHIIFVIALYYDGCEKWTIARTICGFLAATYFFAWVSFRWFESPARRFIRSCANQR